MATVAKRIKTGLRKFADDLKAGKPIKATRLKKVEVDGVPAYVREDVSLRARRPKATLPGSTPGSRSVGRERAEPDTSTYEGRFAARLGALVNKRGIDPRDLAKTLGVNQAAVYAWLAGRKTPAVEKFPAIAAALGVKKPGDILPLE